MSGTSLPYSSVSAETISGKDPSLTEWFRRTIESAGYRTVDRHGEGDPGFDAEDPAGLKLFFTLMESLNLLTISVHVPLTEIPQALVAKRFEQINMANCMSICPCHLADLDRLIVTGYFHIGAQVTAADVREYLDMFSLNLINVRIRMGSK